jgi:hypothetical protein
MIYDSENEDYGIRLLANCFDLAEYCGPVFPDPGTDIACPLYKLL